MQIQIWKRENINLYSWLSWSLVILANSLYISTQWIFVLIKHKNEVFLVSALLSISILRYLS